MSAEKNKEFIEDIQKQFSDMYKLNFGLTHSGHNSIEEIYKLIEKARQRYWELVNEYALNPTTQTFEELTNAVWASAGLVYYIEYLEKRAKGILST